ncbi:MAG: hypothetical protein Q7S18_03020 [bacterium]|nr:hypothetical protein [bacterium]
MDIDVNLLLAQTIKLFNGFIHSPFFLTLKILLAIYTTVLFADLVMLLYFRGFGKVRESLRGMIIPLISPKKMRKRWNKIKSRLESGKTSDYKVAVIEADEVIGKIFKNMRLKGNDMAERLDKLKPNQIENLEDLKKAHKIRNQIINEPEFSVDKKSAEEVIEIYEQFLVDSQFLED